jgi:hypothetical protein
MRTGFQSDRSPDPAGLIRASQRAGWWCVWILCILSVCGVSIQAALSRAEIDELFSQGEQSFRQANEASASDAAAARELYQRAALRWERIAREGDVHNGRLYYNIGNAYFRLNDLGRAILNYRRAGQFIANDANLQQNLQYARERRQDKFEEPQQKRVLRTLFFWHYDISTQSRARLFAVLFCVVWLSAAVRLFFARRSIHWIIGISGTGAALLLGSLLIESAKRAGNQPGVVIEAEVVARKGDSETYEPSFTEPLHAGTEFVLREQRGDWMQVELPDARSCWLPTKSSELVR